MSSPVQGAADGHSSRLCSLTLLQEAQVTSLTAQLHELRARHMQELQAEHARLHDSQQALAERAAAQRRLIEKVGRRAG